MEPLTVGIIGVIVLIILLFSGMPLAVVMTFVGFGGMVIIAGWDAAFALLKTVPFTMATNYELSTIPLFVLMGTLCFYSGLSEQLYRTAYTWLGSMRGGLSMATIGACAAFASVSGSSLATAATMGTVSLPEMKKYRYDSALATGTIAAGGTLGILIPPSVIMIIYGMITETSVGKLFLAGFIPGIIEALFYMIAIYILCGNKPLLGPPGPRTTFRDKMASLNDAWGVAILFIIVLGGIYFGVFSPTEAAGIGAFGAFVFAIIKRKLTWKNFFHSIVETSTTVGMLMVIAIGAIILGYFLAVTRLPFELASSILALSVNRYIVLCIILIFYIFLGTVMDSLAMVLITVPIFFPVITKLGFDPIWFGIIMVIMVEIGMITPPVGVNVFVIKGVAKDVPMYTIFRGIVPFFVCDLILVALLVIMPRLATFLPGIMK